MNFRQQSQRQMGLANRTSLQRTSCRTQYLDGSDHNLKQDTWPRLLGSGSTSDPTLIALRAHWALGEHGAFGATMKTSSTQVSSSVTTCSSRTRLSFAHRPPWAFSSAAFGQIGPVYIYLVHHTISSTTCGGGARSHDVDWAQQPLH